MTSKFDVGDRVWKLNKGYCSIIPDGTRGRVVETDGRGGKGPALFHVKVRWDFVAPGFPPVNSLWISTRDVEPVPILDLMAEAIAATNDLTDEAR